MAVGRTLCLLLASAALAAPAIAQDVAPAGGVRDGAQQGDWQARRRARDAQRSADMALLLRLRPDQQAAYQAWEASTRPPEGEGRGWRRDREEGEPATTAQALDHAQARMGEDEAQMQARLDATRRFYASLTPEQQGLFDALMRLRRGGDREGRGPRGRGMDGGQPAPPPGA